MPATSFNMCHDCTSSKCFRPLVATPMKDDFWAIAKPRMPPKGNCTYDDCVKVAKKAAREFLRSVPEEPLVGE